MGQQVAQLHVSYDDDDDKDDDDDMEELNAFILLRATFSLTTIKRELLLHFKGKMVTRTRQNVML